MRPFHLKLKVVLFRYTSQTSKRTTPACFVLKLTGTRQETINKVFPWEIVFVSIEEDFLLDIRLVLYDTLMCGGE